MRGDRRLKLLRLSGNRWHYIAERKGWLGWWAFREGMISGTRDEVIAKLNETTSKPLPRGDEVVYLDTAP